MQGILLHVALEVELQVFDMFYLRNMMESSQVEVSFIILLSLLKNSRNDTVELQCNVYSSFQIPDPRSSMNVPILIKCE